MDTGQPGGLTELRTSGPDYPAARYALATELFEDEMLDAAIDELPRSFGSTMR
jgi:hypothetical protein